MYFQALQIVSFIIYAAVLLYVLKILRRKSPFRSEPNKTLVSLSVIVPFKNEMSNLPALLKSICELKNPDFDVEFIFVNDHSEDDFRDLFSLKLNFTYSIIDNNGNGKKEALQTGIEKAKGNYIATTDADCVLPSDWLETIDDAEKSDMLIGPVVVSNHDGSFLSDFQYFESIVLLGLSKATININKPISASGANLIFSKKAFQDVGGYDAHTHQKSGDDYFLLNDFYAKGYSVSWLDNASPVYTQPVNSVKKLIRQKTRWVSKTKGKMPFHTAILGTVILLVNFTVVVSTIGVIVGYLPSVFLIANLLKALIDVLYIQSVSKNEGLFFCFRKAFLSGLIYPFYFATVSVLSLFRGSDW
jgi:cellulose synthase/poly-beta-1,6-N-acetylglucosamine synthase-like glycosyltransferase